jgi:hypothetical protein
LIFLSLIVSGCIPVPTFEGEPFSDEVSNLKAGVTTKNDVIERLGEPGATFSQESEFVYTDYQSEVAFISIGGGGATAGRLHFLVLIFDEDGVLAEQYVRSGSGSSGCIQSGWCAGHANRVMRLADYYKDTRAKQFAVEGDQCGIYLYGHFSPTVVVNLDGNSTGNIFGKNVFQYFEVTADTHELRLTREPGAKIRWGEQKELPPPLAIDCAEGESVFIEVNNSRGYSLELQYDADEGREQVLKRDLVVPGYTRKTPSS